MESTILEIQKQLKMIDNAKKAYTEETSRTMQQQRAVIQQLKVENQTMKERLSKEAQVRLMPAELCCIGVPAAAACTPEQCPQDKTQLLQGGLLHSKQHQAAAAFMHERSHSSPTQVLLWFPCCTKQPA